MTGLKVYVAARYDRKDEVTEIVECLMCDGFTVTSTWHREPYAPKVQLPDLPEDEHRDLALRDIRELDEADVILLLTDPPTEPHVRGGKHVEFGYALAKDKELICCGPAENIFHHLPRVWIVDDFHAAVEVLRVLSIREYIGENDGEVRVTDPRTGGQKGQKPARFDLIPPYPLWQLALVYGVGAKKYDDDNWLKGYSWRLSIGALLRHIWKFIMGESLDPESGLSHLAHAIWHCVTLMEFDRLDLGTDDRQVTKLKREAVHEAGD